MGWVTLLRAFLAIGDPAGVVEGAADEPVVAEGPTTTGEEGEARKGDAAKQHAQQQQHAKGNIAFADAEVDGDEAQPAAQSPSAPLSLAMGGG